MENRICPFCRKEIHRLATKCAYCHSIVRPVLTEIEKRKKRRPFLIGAAVVLVMLLVAISTALFSQPNTEVSQAPIQSIAQIKEATNTPSVKTPAPKQVSSPRPTTQSKPVTNASAPVQNNPVATPTPTAQPSPNFTLYPIVTLSDYVKNPSGYIGSGIQFSVVLVNDFLPAGSRGGNTNFLEVMNSQGDRVELEVDSQADWNNVVYWLTKGDSVNVYGLGAQSKTFTSSNAFGSHDTYVPVIIAQRINRCSQYACSDGQMTLVFSK